MYVWDNYIMHVLARILFELVVESQKDLKRSFIKV